MKEVDDLLGKVDAAAKALRKAGGKQVQSAAIKIQLRELATQYFSTVQARVVSVSFDSIGELDNVFQELHRASHISPSTQKCVDLIKTAKKCLVHFAGQTLSQASIKQVAPRATADTLIVSSLNEICPSASLAYQQALTDLDQTDRISWRGPATELREALRETLDLLAPDDEVLATPNFKLEKDASGPTMKQKVRFILKSRGVASGAIATPEDAVQGIEEIVGGLTRSVYRRSSVSTHTATSRTEVARVHAWVRLVFCELLEVPP